MWMVRALLAISRLFPDSEPPLWLRWPITCVLVGSTVTLISHYWGGRFDTGPLPWAQAAATGVGVGVGCATIVEWTYRRGRD